MSEIDLTRAGQTGQLHGAVLVLRHLARELAAIKAEIGGGNADTQLSGMLDGVLADVAKIGGEGAGQNPEIIAVRSYAAIVARLVLGDRDLPPAN